MANEKNGLGLVKREGFLKIVEELDSVAYEINPLANIKINIEKDPFSHKMGEWVVRISISVVNKPESVEYSKKIGWMVDPDIKCSRHGSGRGQSLDSAFINSAKDLFGEIELHRRNIY